MFRVEESPYTSSCLLWAAALVWLCAIGRGLASTRCLFYLTTVVCRFLPILLHAEWAAILQQVTADTTMTCTLPVLSSNLRQMAALVFHFFHSLRSKFYTTFSVSGCVLHVLSIPRTSLGCTKRTCDVLLAEVRRMQLWILTVSLVHCS